MLTKHQRRCRANEYRRRLREWRRTRPRKRYVGAKRARLWAKRPLSIWPSPTPLRYSGGIRITIPRTFSLIEDPETSIGLLKTLRDVAASSEVREISIEHSRCERLDLCASALMDVLLMKAKSQWRRTKQPVIVRGQLPAELNDVHKLLVNSGVVVNVVQPAAIPAEVAQGTAPFRLVKGGRTGPLETGRKEKVSTDLAEYFGSCLLKHGFQLRPEAKGSLAAMVSEILDNSELHSNSDGAWYVIGHFAEDPTSSVRGTCHIALFNFGDSIYESLVRKDTPLAIQDRLGAMSGQHGRSVLNPTGIRRSALWTLYALQEGVSRLAGAKGEIGRGGGTVDMMRFFNDLSSGNHRMAIVSGDAYILVDGRYSPGKDSAGNTVIAFNSMNDLSVAPDPDCVRALSVHFPGTLISLRFPINKEHLEGMTLASVAESVEEQGLARYGRFCDEDDRSE